MVNVTHQVLLMSMMNHWLDWQDHGQEVRNTVVFLLPTMSCSKPVMALDQLITDALGMTDLLWQAFAKERVSTLSNYVSRGMTFNQM